MFDELVALAMMEERKRRADAVMLVTREPRSQRQDDKDRMTAWQRLKEFLEGPGEAAVIVPATVRAEAAHWSDERLRRW